MNSGSFGKGCFLENRKNFASLEKEPEKYNFYTGLAKLAEDLETLSHAIYTIERQLNNLSR